MPDIAMRFHKDMLVLSSPVEPILAQQGFDLDQGVEFASLVEPEAMHDALSLSVLAGAQCIITCTSGLTSARLSHRYLEDRADEVLRAALDMVADLAPQHTLVEVGPCGLPLDASSKNSLNENRDQYLRVARLETARPFDAFFLNGFQNPVDLKCALMGLRKASDLPIFASVDVDDDGTMSNGRYTLDEACEVMFDYEASVMGIATSAPLNQAVNLARRVSAGPLPSLVQLAVRSVNPKQGIETPENPYYCADAMFQAGVQLRAAGVQFLRAAGQATPAYTGALVAATDGFDVVPELGN